MIENEEFSYINERTLFSEESTVSPIQEENAEVREEEYRESEEEINDNAGILINSTYYVLSLKKIATCIKI